MAACGSDSGGSDAAAGSGNCVGTKKLDVFVSDPKLCVYTFAEGLGDPRQMAFASNGDLFVNNGEVTVLWDENEDGYSAEDERSRFGTAPDLNHGLVFAPDESFLYASSSEVVYRWPYSSGEHTASEEPQVVVSGIPGGDGHGTRTVVFDSQGRLYVSVGSAGNVDQEPDQLANRSQIRRFTIPAALPNAGMPYADGEIVATGMRNEVGLFIDAKDRLWGVENGRDNLHDSDLGGDIHDDNPGEELNLVNGEGSSHYGYPFCFTEYRLAMGGQGMGTQWADESLNASNLKTDAWCRDTANVHPPVYVMPAHWAPLGIIQYTGSAMPYTGDLLIPSHGSWNREPSTGRVLAHAKLEDDAVTDFTILIGQKDGAGELVQGDAWDVRPVDVRQGPDEALYLSDDGTGTVLKVGYER